MGSTVTVRRAVATGFGVALPSGLFFAKPASTLDGIKLKGGAFGLSESQCTFDGVTITHSLAEEGGAIYSVATSLLLYNSELKHNRVSHRGGGISISGGTPTIENTLIEANMVGGRGIWGESNEVEDIRESSGGGGLYCVGVMAGTLSVVNAAITANVVDTGKAVPQDTGGGGVMTYCNAALKSVAVTNNAIGSLHLTSLAPQTTLDGGGLQFFRSTVTLSQVTLAHNTAAGSGGGVVVEECSNVEITSSAIQHNRALIKAGGGAKILNPITPTRLIEVLIEGNTAASGDGGGVLIQSQTRTNISDVAQLSNCTIKVNTALGGGGGVMLMNVRGASLSTLEGGRNQFTNNNATYGVHMASDPHSLRLSQEDALALDFDEAFAEQVLMLTVLDEHGEVVSTYHGIGSVIYKAIFDVHGTSVADLPSSPYSVAIHHGVGDFHRMAFPLPPGYIVEAFVSLNTEAGVLTSPSFVVDLRPCPSGFYLPSASATTCFPCPAGFYSRLQTENQTRASPDCQPCAPGTFSSALSSVSCTLCAAGTFAAISGAKECAPCQEGFYAGLGWESCMPCVDGATCTGGRLRFQDGWWLHQKSLFGPDLHRHPATSSVVSLVNERCRTNHTAFRFEEESCMSLTECIQSALSSSLPPHWALPREATNTDIAQQLAVDRLGIGVNTELFACRSSLSCVRQCNASLVNCAVGHKG